MLTAITTIATTAKATRRMMFTKPSTGSVVVAVVVISLVPSMLLSEAYKIVTLGDSYTSGNGARNPVTGGIDYDGPMGCYRSQYNWGQKFVDGIIAAASDIVDEKRNEEVVSITYINGACSGSHVQHLYTAWERGVLDGPCPTDPIPNDDESYEEVITPINGQLIGHQRKCKNVMKPQIDYYIDDSVDMVLMTTGGNDVGFVNLVKYCMDASMASASSCANAVDESYILLMAMRAELTEALIQIKDRMGQNTRGRVVYISYPYIILDDKDYTLSDENLTYDVTTSIRELMDVGDRYAAEAVEDANKIAGREYITFFNHTKALFDGHEPDPFSSSRSSSIMYPNPDDRCWFYETYDVDDVNEWIHFNSYGHENLAMELIEIIGPEIKDDIIVSSKKETSASQEGQHQDTTAAKQPPPPSTNHPLSYLCKRCSLLPWCE